MKQSKRNLWWSVCAGLLFCSWGCSSRVSDKPVTLETLLDEMVSVEEQALYPVPSYTCRHPEFREELERPLSGDRD